MTPSALIERILQGESSDLPVAPQIVQKFTKVCRDPMATANDLANVLQMDTGLASRILRRVNSSLYGLNTKVITVTKAVVVLGFKEIRNIALSVPVAAFFHKNEKSPGLDIGRLWNHNVETGCVARRLATHIGYSEAEQIFVYSILRNIGMVAMNSVLGKEYLTLVHAHGGQDDFPVYEEKELGISHIQVGCALAERWSFPPEFIEFVKEHHFFMSGDRVLVEPSLVRVARHLLQGTGRGKTTQEVLANIPAPVVKSFHLTGTACETVLTQARQDFKDTLEMLAH